MPNFIKIGGSGIQKLIGEIHGACILVDRGDTQSLYYFNTNIRVNVTCKSQKKCTGKYVYSKLKSIFPVMHYSF
jgi:hypothetical protein